MIPHSLANELDKELPYLIRSYGGLPNFLAYMKQNLDIHKLGTRSNLPTNVYQKAINFIYTILSKKNNLILISPWSLTVDLAVLENDNQVSAESIDFDEPYTVHDLQGNLLYTVKGHNGFFGRSQLDKLLINNSVNTSAYYLNYVDYNGFKHTKLLMVTLFTKEILVENDLLQTVDSINQSNITIANFSSAPVLVTTYEGIPQSNPSVASIQSLGFNETIEPQTSRSFVPTKGTWYYIETFNNIVRTQITRPDNDILILVKEVLGSYNLYYLGLNVATSTLNRTFNVGLDFSDKRVDEIIEIRDTIL